MNNPSIGIVIVNYNGEKFQNDCIESILNNKYDNYKIIIVDNNSKDNSMKMLDNFNDNRIIKIFCEENYGIAKGNNIGITKSIELGLDYTILLNNDTVLDENFILELLKLTPQYKVVVPKIYFYDTNLIWYYGGSFSKLKGANKDWNYKKTDETMIKATECDYAPTCCMLIDNRVFDQIGLMDENYFLYFDDTDFCFRLFENNIKIGLCENSIVYHKVSQSAGGYSSKLAIYYLSRNNLYFRKKYPKYFGFLSYFYIMSVKRTKIMLSKLRKDNNFIIKEAIKDYKSGNMGRNNNL